VFPTNGDFIKRHAQAISMSHKVSVLHIVSREENENEISIEIKIKNNINTYIAYIKPTKNILIKAVRFFRAYSKIMISIGVVDLVHLNSIFPFGLFALYMKWLKKTPFIISEHWSGYKEGQINKISFFEKSISKFVTHHATFVCPVSENLKNSMLKFGLHGNYKPIPNVVDTDLFRLGIKDLNKFSIVHISSLKDNPKNISGMLSVAKKLESAIGNFTWKFIGGKSDHFESLIKKLNFKEANIEFIPHISQDKLVAHLQSASLSVLFSDYENLPCVILESFACGTPVISTNVGGISEYFPEKFGHLIEKQNETQLLERILEEHVNPNSCSDEMSLYAQEQFSKKTISHAFSKLYEQTIYS
jgi:glycosyltransferase involved in cell wall biosynthesis